jgi:NADH-quinone oxidoreductase subunit C
VADLTIDALKERFTEAIVATRLFRGEITVTLRRDKLVETATELRDDPDWRFNFLSDITCADMLPRKPRFDVVYHLCSVPSGRRLRLKVQVDLDDAVLPTVTGVWPAANWYEREVFDLFGIRFDGHPNLIRILLPEDYDGHPLRRDHPTGKAKIPFGPTSERPPWLT